MERAVEEAVVSDTVGLIFEGVTADGRTVKVFGDPAEPHLHRFVIDGVDAPVSRYNLYRDGGTRTYETAKGTVTFPRRLGSDDRVPRLDGQLLARVVS